MIPWVAAPLSGLTVLVTRPLGQGAGLCARIEKLGGEAIEFPALTIEALQAATPLGNYQSLIFVSVNAVKHGLPLIQTLLQATPAPRIAAVGKVTAAALVEAGVNVDVFPDAGSGSEALLASVAATFNSVQRVLIVRGVGGRELLQENLRSLGMEVEVLEVYRRLPANPATELVHELEARWTETGIGIVTATSVDTLLALNQLLTPPGRTLLRTTPLLTPSARVRDAARELGLVGECLVSPSAEEDALVGTLAYWRARAR